MNPHLCNRLFIVAESRSGSNWLVETLNNHPDIFLLKEIFQPEQRKKFSEEERMAQYREIDNDLLYLEKRLEESTQKISGCKILTSQAIRFLDFFKFIEYYREASFIFLSRRSSIRAEISGEIARTYQRRHVRQNHSQILRVRLEPADFYRRLQWRTLRNNFVRGMMDTYGVRLHEVHYEQLFSDKAGEIKKILEFLNIARDMDAIKSIYSDEERANPFSINEIVENYKEIEEYLKPYPHYYDMLIDNEC